MLLNDVTSGVTLIGQSLCIPINIIKVDLIHSQFLGGWMWVWEGGVGGKGGYGRVGVKGGVGGKREKESNGCHLVARIRNIMLKYISILPLNSYKKTTS